MSYDFKSTDYLENSPYERKLVLLDEANCDPGNPQIENNDSFFEPCYQIIYQIKQSKIMTIQQLQFVLSSPQFILKIDDSLCNADYILENEYEMVKECLNMIPKGHPFDEFLNVCLWPKCKNPKVPELVLNECLKNIENPHYSAILSCYSEKYKNIDIWPFALRMNEGFVNVALSLCYKNILPKDKSEVIKKIKANPSSDDFTLLRLLQLTNEEFDKENICQYLLDTLKSSIFSLDEAEEAKVREIFLYIGDRMNNMKIFYPAFIDVAIDLISNGTIDLKQESIKFLNLISEQLPKNAILSMIQNGSIEVIIDLFDSDQSSSVIESASKVLLIFLAKCPEQALPHIDFDYLVNSLNSLEGLTDTCNLAVGRILTFIQASANNENDV